MNSSVNQTVALKIFKTKCLREYIRKKRWHEYIQTKLWREYIQLKNTLLDHSLST